MDDDTRTAARLPMSKDNPTRRRVMPIYNSNPKNKKSKERKQISACLVREKKDRQRYRTNEQNPGAFTNLTPMAFKSKTGQAKTTTTTRRERCTLPDKMMIMMMAMMMLVDHECGSRMHLAAHNQQNQSRESEPS